ncbi:rapunzel 5 isoform 1-T1 [Clarias gariepinus]|uniref:rapunzel 5 n=1 Tax=Clarias gariepinus TaxID=13013 RepID=UPI00234DF785|nr:rapunzel 5 [Clarias gariepinus]
MSRVEEWVLENKDKIEKGVEIMSQGCEVLAATVGQFHPILEAVFVASAELLSNPEGKEAKYLAEQFERVNQKLEGIQDEIEKLALELQRTSLNKQNFDREAQMISQYEKFQEFVIAKPKFKEKKKEKFLSHYENTDRDVNLDGLYNAVTGENTSGDAMLDTILVTEQMSRRAVEEFCARLKKLFVVGIIAVMGYTALKEGTVGEDMVKKWQGRMEDVEKRMKAAVDECVNNFPEQAKKDVEHKLVERQSSVDPEFTKFLLDSLAKKYDWVSWSVRVFNHSGIFFWNWLAGKRYHGSGGGINYFDLLTDNKVRIVVSFTANPKPLNKVQIKDQIENEKLKGDMISVAESLCKSLPNCLVHAVSRYKRVEEANNFVPECYYYAAHKRAHICIHSE